MQPQPKKARLDADRRCKPLTEIVAYVRPIGDRRVVFDSDIVEYEYRDTSFLWHCNVPSLKP